MPTLDTPTRQFIERESIERDGAGSGLPHLPGLDGLRGLAVAAVVAYHAGHDLAPGGFLGVSTFFTLSGFLITTLLLHETDRTGTVDLRAFWGRRFRRLLPASAATLLLVVVFGLTVATAGQRVALRGDVLASLLQVANWHFVLGGTSYGDLFGAPSPVLHFWSLAIEEQFYWLFPPLLLGLVKVCRSRRAGVLVGLLVLSAVSWGLPVLLGFSNDRAYFGTDARAVELLLGAALAVVLANRSVRRRLALRLRARTASLVLGAVCLAVQAYWWFTIDQGAEWLYGGGLGLYGLMTCAVIVAVALPTGPARSLFSLQPLRYLGLRSYAIYLLHWPIFLALRQQFPDLEPVARTAIGVAATLLLSEVSYRLLEHPVRTARWPARGTGVRFAAASMVVVGLVACVPMPVQERDEPIDFESALDEFEARRQQAPASTPAPTALGQGGDARTTTPTVLDMDEYAPSTSTTVPRAPIPRIATFGDSTALLMALGLDRYLVESGLPGGVLGSVELGCGVSRFDAIRLEQSATVSELCKDWPDRWAAALARDRPDIAQLVTGVWEVADARLPGASDFAAVGTPPVDAFVESELLAAVDTLSSTGALVLLVLWPPDVADIGAAESGRLLRTPPERMAAFHDLQRRVAAARPESVRIVDLAAWFGPRSQDALWRPDGVHLQEDRAAQVYREWLATETDRIWQLWWRERNGAAG